MKKSLLIFDLDGTLIDSVPDLTTALQLALDDLNMPTCSIDDVRRYVGNGARKLCERALYQHTATISNDMLDRLHARFIHHYAAHTCVNSKAYPDVMQGLKDLTTHGFILAIASNKPAAFLPAILTHFAWQDFVMCLGGDSLAHKKPHPAPLLHICHTLNIPHHQAVMIGDSKNDIAAGKAADMTTLGLSYGYNYGEPLIDSMPDAIFDTFAALTAHILSAFG